MAAPLVNVRCEHTAGVDLQGETVRVIVGGTEEDQRTFHLHENLLRQTSAFFEAALVKCWKEGVERLVRLPEEEAEVFGLYAQWLYVGCIACDGLEPNNTGSYFHLAKLWIMGGKLLSPKLQNCVMDAIIGRTRTHNNWPIKSVVAFVYRKTSEGSPLRKLLVDQHVMVGDETWLWSRQEKGKNNAEFVVDLALALLGET